jgi:MFS transporter, DHA2 family, methylenomycin A resistance protein
VKTSILSLPRTVALNIAATSMGFAVVQLDVTIVNVALPRIDADLGASVTALQWVVDAYTLTFAVLLLTGGALSDRLGARSTFAAGFAVFGLASLICGLTADIASLVAARALQGVGAALVVPSSLALLDAACRHDAALRARAVGLWTAAGGVSIAAGPIIGAALLTGFGWPSVFLVNVPICGVALLLAFCWLQAQPHRRSRKLDPMGQVLAIIALTALVASIIEASSPSVDGAAIAAGVAVASVAALAFGAVEARTDAAMLPLAFFQRPGFAAAILFGTAVNLTYYGMMFVLTLYLQHTRGYSASAAGLAYLPLTATFIVSNVASGPLAARFGPRALMAAGPLVGSVGFALLSRLDDTTPYLAMLPAFALIPLGMGLAVPAMTTVMLASVDRQSTGIASGALNAARQVGGAVGVALFGTRVGVAGDDVIAGLHESAWTSVTLLALAAIVAWRGLPSRARESAAKPLAQRCGIGE